MHCFGDGSGTFNNVLQGDEECFSIAVIGGAPERAAACPGKFIRKLGFHELKWYNLERHADRRRVMECLGDCENSGLWFAYTVVTREDLLELQSHYMLLQDGHLDTRPDIFAKAVFYSDLLETIGELSGNRPEYFYFDKFGPKPNWEEMKAHLYDLHGGVDHRWEGSRQRKGIQAADCIAGAARGDRTMHTSWIGSLPGDRVQDCTDTSLERLEQALMDI